MSVHGEIHPRQQNAVRLLCQGCGHAGVSLWQDFETGRQLVTLEGFHERLSREEPFPIETVCNNCGTVQPI